MNTGTVILIVAALFVVGIVVTAVAAFVLWRKETRRRELAQRTPLEKALDKRNFYLQEPRAPGKDVRAWMLAAPAIASVVGFCCFSILAYSFTEMATWPHEFRYAMVLVGSITMAVGGEIGTYVAVDEIFRKSGGKRPAVLDCFALAISAAATMVTLFLSIAALMGLRGSWPEWVVLYGPVALVICTAADAYAGMMEGGLYKARYDERHEEWQRKYQEWCADMAVQLGFSKPETEAIKTETEPIEIKTPVSPVDESWDVANAIPLPIIMEEKQATENATELTGLRDVANTVLVSVNPKQKTNKERAGEILAEHPGITGAAMGRKLGLSERQGQNIKNAVIAAGNGRGG